MLCQPLRREATGTLVEKAIAIPSRLPFSTIVPLALLFSTRDASSAACSSGSEQIHRPPKELAERPLVAGYDHGFGGFGGLAPPCLVDSDD